ncbi:PSD1 and planctomycete cytochrome C domain-containing protein [Occallatibacter savannae]|uniref:PSD1 and planctomycete cytochrome C domain-containing protein n=1 Tax=Occallatibacter savannae TaxID=1002691 RepID=UPI0013A5642C|nr:PSD1 and planctomycete cytochrome C domain-containing protein [Occallatibacter savannae]
MKPLSALAGTCVLSIGVASFGATGVSASDNASAPGDPDYHAKRVRPIFEANCLQCHDSMARGGLQLNSYAAIRKGGEDGPVIVPGDPDASLLIQAIRRRGDLKMPPKVALPSGDVATLEAWVKAGAAGSDAALTPASGPAKNDSGTAAGSAPTPSRVVPTAAAVEVNADFFENKVRPIFANHCYDCHGDSASGGLRLDTKAGFDQGGKRGPLIVSGDPDRSLLIQAVRQTGALKMPKGGKLSAEDVAVLEQWVKHGAPWPATSSGAITSITAKTGAITPEQRNFWSFQPLKTVTPPRVEYGKLAHWPHSAIDHFILAGLHQAGLAPAAQVDRRTLIRRATFDLTGLSPTQAEVDAFVSDKSPAAWEKVIDRLLASPRYGERWGRHWLDVARYAEDDVRGLDPKRRGYMPFAGAYRYRDWVIKAFNDDVPYDRFVTMQLAGDKLPFKSEAEHQDNITATTYLGAGPWVWDQAEPVQGRADERNERVDAVTRGLLGLTVACARCHNHKYDPIPQKDYYKIVGVFANSTYTEYPVVSKAAAEAWNSKNLEAAKLRADLHDYTTDLGKQLAQALSIQTSDYVTAAWHVLGKPKKTVDEVSAEKHLDPEVLQRWVDYLQKDHPYPYLDDWKAMIASQNSSEDQARVLGDAFQKTVLRVRDENSKIEEENDIVRAKNDVPKHRLLDAKPSEFETFDQFCPGCQLELKALPTSEAKLYLDLFVSQSGDMDEKFIPGVMFFEGWSLTRRLGPQWQAYIEAQHKRIEALDKELKASEYPFVHGMADKSKIEDVKLNVRGNPHAMGDVAPRGFLAVLSSPQKPAYSDGSGRLEFATDIVRQALTARVIVNRIWKWHFGTGLVNTPDNFGVMGDKPSNPQLLEFLAREFVDHHQSIKWLQRQIMLSAVYQTTVEESPEAHEKDPANRLYSHFNRQRLDAEELRDSMLFAAGDLDLKDTSGPSTEFTSDNLRRTVFCKVSRYRLNNYLMVFDFPNPSFTAEQRFSSNVPLQQLHFMNNPFVYKQSGVLAERVHDEQSDEARITKAYELLFQRKPTPEEVQLGRNFLSTTPEKPGYTVEGKPVTAWSEYMRALFSSNEFQFVN